MRIDPCLIDLPLEHIDPSIFERGYSYADDEGIWYEVFKQRVYAGANKESVKF